MPVRSAVTVSLVPEARGGPFVYWDDLVEACRAARSLGFDAIEIFPPSPDAPALRDLGRLLSEHGLALAAVGTGAGWVKERLHLVLPDASSRARARAFIKAMIDVAGAHGAPAIIGSMQGRSGDGVDHGAALGYLGEALEELGQHAAQYRVSLVYEPLNRYETNIANTVAGGLQVLAGLSTRNVVLLADLFHMNIEEADIAGAIRQGGRAIGHVHFVDSNRRAAGFGHLDYQPIVAALAEIGYEGYLSAEVLPLPGSDAAAQQTIQAFRRFFRNATVPGSAKS